MMHGWHATGALALFLVSSTSLFASANSNADPNPKPSPVAVAAAADGTEPEPKPKETFKPCQIRSPNTNNFYDLNPIRIVLPEKDEDESKSFYSGWSDDVRHTSWHARGYDYLANFTINFCGPVVEEMKSVVDVPRSKWQNVSAFYTMEDKQYSIGQQNHELVFRGRKLLLNYTEGSPCPEPEDPPEDSNTDENQPQKRQRFSTNRRKSTLISLLCERDPTAAKATVTFVGTTDHCTYFFEARSIAACPAFSNERQQVGPSGVFGLIFGIAFIVYVLGGVVYQRAVLHQRGWRQLPNYSLWASIATFITDVLVIIFSSCMRCCSSGSRKSTGYGQLPNGSSGYGQGFSPSSRNSPARYRDGRDLDDETRLIDQLDEEWDD